MISRRGFLFAAPAFIAAAKLDFGVPKKLIKIEFLHNRFDDPPPHTDLWQEPRFIMRGIPPLEGKWNENKTHADASGGYYLDNSRAGHSEFLGTWNRENTEYNRLYRARKLAEGANRLPNDSNVDVDKIAGERARGEDATPSDESDED